MLLHRLQVEMAVATRRDVPVVKCIVNLNQRELKCFVWKNL